MCMEWNNPGGLSRMEGMSTFCSRNSAFVGLRVAFVSGNG